MAGVPARVAFSDAPASLRPLIGEAINAARVIDGIFYFHATSKLPPRSGARSRLAPCLRLGSDPAPARQPPGARPANAPLPLGCRPTPSCRPSRACPTAAEPPWRGCGVRLEEDADGPGSGFRRHPPV